MSVRLPGSTRRRSGPGESAEAGQAIIEMVVVLPLLLFLVFGIVEFAAAWRTYHVVTNSSREGARRAVVLGSGGTKAQVDAVVQSRLAAGGLNPTLATIAVECEDPDDGSIATNSPCTGSDAVGKMDRVEVVFPYTFTVLGPVANLICGSNCGTAYGTVNLTAQTVMRHE